MGAAVIIIGAAIFAIGVVVGIFVVTSISIQREERKFRKTGWVSMTRLAPDRASDGTRSLVALSARNCADVNSAAVYEDMLV